MKGTNKRQGVFAISVMSLLLALAVPATTMAQGRLRGRHNGDWSNRNWSNSKKYGKFVNGHDARDGRWDSRGARGDRVGNIVDRNRIRERNRSFNNNDGDWRNVRRNRNRNFDNNDGSRRGIINRNRDFNDGRDSSGNRKSRHPDN
jgi:hypothetical protein